MEMGLAVGAAGGLAEGRDSTTAGSPAPGLAVGTAGDPAANADSAA